MKKIKKTVFVLAILFISLFVNITKVSAFFDSPALISITSPENNFVTTLGTIPIEYRAYNCYVGTLNGTMETRIDWFTTKNGEYYSGGSRAQMSSTKGDAFYEQMGLKFTEGGLYTFNLVCVPINIYTGKVDERVSPESYPGKSIKIHVYEDKPANASFEESVVLKDVGDENFVNPLNTNSDGKVTYSSSDTKVAKVDSKTGEVKVVGKGVAKITAKVERSYIYREVSKSYNIHVYNPEDETTNVEEPVEEPEPTEKPEEKPAKTNPSLSFASTSVSKTTTDAAFTNKLRTNSDGKITYKSSNNNVATVDSKGLVTIKGAGTASITASVSETSKFYAKSISYKLTVTAPQSSAPSGGNNSNGGTSSGGTSSGGSSSGNSSSGSSSNSGTQTGKSSATLKFASASLTKKIGDASFTNKLTATTDGTITYKSSNANVATVSSTGTVTIKAAGSVTITATSSETSKYKAATASYTLNVVKKSPSAYFYNSGKTYTRNQGPITNKVQTDSDGAVTYSSSNTSVASVDNNGKVTFVGTGTVTITATIAETATYKKATGSYTLTITANASTNPTPTNTTPTCSFVNTQSPIYKTYTNQLITIKNTVVTNSPGAVTYSTSDAKVAVVDATTGKVTVKGVGNATITASIAASGQYSATSCTYKIVVN